MDQLQRAYEDLLEKIRMVAGHTDRNTQDIHELIARSQQNEQLEGAIKVFTAIYSSARAYTNVVILAGYAAFFAAWGFLRNDIAHRASLWALFLMMVSAAVFVAFEVGKMIWISTLTRRFSKGLYNGNPLAALENLRKNEQREAVFIGRIWIWALIGTLVPGFTAFGVLAWNLVGALLHEPVPVIVGS